MTLSTGRIESFPASGAVSGSAPRLFQNAKARVDLCAAAIPLGQSGRETRALTEAYHAAKRRGLKLRIITTITKKNVSLADQLADIADVRHLEGLKGNFAVSDTEYVCNPRSDHFGLGESDLLYSDDPGFVRQNQQLYEVLWETAQPAEARINEIKRGIEPPKVEVISDPERMKSVYLDVLRGAKTEIMLLIPSVMSFHRQENLGVIDILEEAARKRKLRVRVLTATDSIIEGRISNEQAKPEVRTSPILFSRITPAMEGKSVMVLLADRKTSFVIEKEDDSLDDFVRATSLATYSTGQATVHANIGFFETLWNASELLEQEAIGRTQAQLKALETSEAWEITPAKFRCVRCGRKVEREIRIYDPRLMQLQAEVATAAMRKNDAGWIPFCFNCISTHPLLKPSWLVVSGTRNE